MTGNVESHVKVEALNKILVDEGRVRKHLIRQSSPSLGSSRSMDSQLSEFSSMVMLDEILGLEVHVWKFLRLGNFVIRQGSLGRVLLGLKPDVDNHNFSLLFSHHLQSHFFLAAGFS